MHRDGTVGVGSTRVGPLDVPAAIEPLVWSCTPISRDGGKVTGAGTTSELGRWLVKLAGTSVATPPPTYTSHRATALAGVAGATGTAGLVAMAPSMALTTKLPGSVPPSMSAARSWQTTRSMRLEPAGGLGVSVSVSGPSHLHSALPVLLDVGTATRPGCTSIDMPPDAPGP